MKLIEEIQTLIPITKMELSAVAIIFSFFCVGLVLNLTDYRNQRENERKLTNIFYKLDSLARVNQTTFIGTDENGEPYKVLADKDTIVQKDIALLLSRDKFNKEKLLPSQKININKASKSELMKLPGVGEAIALKIIEYREKQKFNKPKDIMKVKGIGQKKYEKLKDYIEVK